MSAATLIAKIDIRLAALLDDDSIVGDYRIGDKQVDKGTYLKYLTDMRASLIKQGQEETPYESVDTLAYDINELGEDVSEYVGEDW